MSSLVNSPPVVDGGPVWPLADLFPLQGDWTEDAFLRLDRPGVELVEGRLEFREEMQTYSHNSLADWLVIRLTPVFGWKNIKTNGYALRTGPQSDRYPDLMASFTRDGWEEKRALAADLVVEVVSSSAADQERDYVNKRVEYERVGVPEYWIVDPSERHVTVFTLDEDQYRQHGVFSAGGNALTSLLVADLSIDVREWFEEALG